MHPQLIVMCGLPGAGKTTIAKLTKGTIISRAKHPDDAYEIIAQLLNEGKDVTYDAQNLTEEERKGILTYIKEHVVVPVDSTCIFIQKSVVDCMTELENQNRYIPIKALLQLYNQTQVPSYNEGWQCIITVTENAS